MVFHADFPSVTLFTAWNEANDGSEPTAHQPVLAAHYYDALQAVCPSCTVVAADVLDQAGMTGWVKSFRRAVKGNPQLWGLHDYEDVNFHRSSGTRAFLASVPGTVWLTETGGLVRFNEFGYNPKRAAAATRYLFSDSPHRHHGSSAFTSTTGSALLPLARAPVAFINVAARIGTPA